MAVAMCDECSLTREVVEASTGALLCDECISRFAIEAVAHCAITPAQRRVIEAARAWVRYGGERGELEKYRLAGAIAEAVEAMEREEAK